MLTIGEFSGNFFLTNQMIVAISTFVKTIVRTVGKNKFTRFGTCKTFFGNVTFSFRPMLAFLILIIHTSMTDQFLQRLKAKGSFGMSTKEDSLDLVATFVMTMVQT